MRCVWPVLVFGVACSASAPKSAADCVDIGSDAARDECYLSVLVETFKADREEGTRIIESELKNPLNRDFAWYDVTQRVDPNTDRYCKRIQERQLAARCRDFVARPPLHRELGSQPEQGPGAPMGPPGGPGGRTPPSSGTGAAEGTTP